MQFTPYIQYIQYSSQSCSSQAKTSKKVVQIRIFYPPFLDIFLSFQIPNTQQKICPSVQINKYMLTNNECMICDKYKNQHILKIISTYLYFLSPPDSFPAAIKSRNMYYFQYYLSYKSQRHRFKRSLVQFLLLPVLR